MPLLTGSLSARVWRAVDPLPPEFKSIFSRNIKRHAFRPIEVEKGAQMSSGWVSLRQPLDAELSLDKCLFGGVLALAYRVDRISINPRLYRATLQEEMQKIRKEKGRDKLTDDQRQALEEQVRRKLLKSQPASMSIFEMAWRLESGLVFFAASGNRINIEFSERFAQTFNISLEPQLPYIRAEKLATRQRLVRELRESLPSPFSPDAPAEVIEIGESAVE